MSRSSHRSDEVLMLLAGQRDRTACAELVERHRDRVRAIARRMLGRADESEDVAQDVFLRVWCAAPAWQPRARFTTWLHRVAVNVCLDRVARRRELPSETLTEIADLSEEPSRRADAHQLGRDLQRALAALPEGQRTALVLCHQRGLQHREVAILMGLSPEALESLVARARRAMRLRCDFL